MPAAYQARNRFRHVYKDPRWPPLSRQVRLEEPFCQLRLPGCTLLSEVTDHVEPHRGDERLAYARGNLQALCRACHGIKTAGEVNRR